LIQSFIQTRRSEERDSDFADEGQQISLFRSTRGDNLFRFCARTLNGFQQP
jgi:hypothetical protein